MESRILQVFYGNDCLPFKDKERSVHFPIVGNAFLGTNNIQKIRFYVDRIGGALNVTWVATTKLPNGKIIYELLNETQYDDEIGEYYAELTLTQPYSALKGDLFIGLSGYQGGVQVEEDSDTGIYSITGTPTIQATGVIKFSINYAPSTLPKETLGFTDLQQVLGYLADFLQQGDSIVVIANTSVDLTGFEEGQIFFCKADQLIYKLVSGSLAAQKSGYVPYTGATANVHLEPYSLSANTLISQDTEFADNEVIITKEYANVYKFRVKSDTTEDFIATEDYVDNNIYEMASASVVLNDSDYAYLLKNNVRIHYGNFFYEKAKETASQVIFYSVDYQRTTTGGSTGYTTRTTKKITLTKSSQQLDAADINDLSYNKEQTDKNFAHSFDATINTTDYKLTLTLKNKDGNALSTKVIDLPLESIVVSATYYDTYTYGGTTYTKVIVIVLATTDVPTIIPVGDLVDGLATTTQLTNGLALKVNKTDIADNLNTNDATKVLSAKQGYELNNAVVHLTGNETIAGNKSFTGSTSFKYDINFTSPDGTKSGAFRLVDNGNFIWRVANASKLMYDYANGNFSSWVDIVGNGDNAQSLGNATHYWKDLYLKGKWKDGTNEKSLQDLLDENAELNAKLNKLQEEFNETTVDVKTYTYNYLLTSAIPSAIDSQPVIESAGMDCVNVKGNSYVYNQKIKNGNFENTSNWELNGTGTFTVSNNVATILCNGANRLQQELGDFIINHKYLICCDIQLNQITDNSGLDVRITDLSHDIVCSVDNTITALQKIRVITTNSNVSGLVYFMLRDARANKSEFNASNVQLFDLTQLGLDSATTTDEAIAGLMQLGINPYEYNAYNEGAIIDSKPTKLVSKGFNQWDEEWEVGGINNSSGENEVSTTRIRSKNYISVVPNVIYFYKVPTGKNIYVHFYDANYNHIENIGNVAGLPNMAIVSNQTFETPKNAHYMRFRMNDDYGTTYNHDICINISNASLNGTYRPYIAPNEYALDLPILRSVPDYTNQVMINDKKVQSGETTRKCYSYTFTGEETWNKSANTTDNNSFYCNLVDLPAPKADLTTNAGGSYVLPNVISSKGYDVMASIYVVSYNNANVITVLKRPDGGLQFRYGAGLSSTITTEQVGQLFAGTTIIYELETPTTESGTPLPENIAIQKGGTITAEYDNTGKAPSDFEFDIATSKIV